MRWRVSGLTVRLVAAEEATGAVLALFTAAGLAGGGGAVCAGAQCNNSSSWRLAE
jgi:hypothetical protein